MRSLGAIRGGRRSALIAILLLLGLAGFWRARAETRVEAGPFTEIFDPRRGEKEPWCINDHTFVRDEAGTWHVFGITHVAPFHFARDPGTNLLHATARSLRQNPWRKEPMALTADWPRHREWLLWAPHVVRAEGLYQMMVCVGAGSGHQYAIHRLTSTNLWNWQRTSGGAVVVDGFDGRDPNLLHVGDEWVMYYTATVPSTGGHHAVAAVRSRDWTHWDRRQVVFTHEREGTFGGPTESPFVVRRGTTFYLFVCDGGTINVFSSRDPLHWDPRDQVGSIAAHAAEVVRDVDGAWYISHAGWERGGLSLAPLRWHDGLDAAEAWPAAGH